MPTTDKTHRVLVVDDNRDGADALGLLLEELGHQVHVTYGGTKALEVATAFRPDLMLIDLVMPDMNGCGLVARFRQFPAFAQTRIVAITGKKEAEHKNSALQAGFDAVLFKPVALVDIKAVLASVFVSDAGQSPKRAEERARSQRSDVSSAPASLPLVLMVVFWMLLGGAAGINITQSLWRLLGWQVGNVAIAVPVGGAIGSLCGGLLGLISKPHLLVLLMAVFAGSAAGAVAGRLPWDDVGEIGGQVVGALIGLMAWAVWLYWDRKRRIKKRN